MNKSEINKIVFQLALDLEAMKSPPIGFDTEVWIKETIKDLQRNPVEGREPSDVLIERYLKANMTNK